MRNRVYIILVLLATVLAACDVFDVLQAKQVESLLTDDILTEFSADTVGIASFEQSIDSSQFDNFRFSVDDDILLIEIPTWNLIYELTEPRLPVFTARLSLEGTALWEGSITPDMPRIDTIDLLATGRMDLLAEHLETTLQSSQSITLKLETTAIPVISDYSFSISHEAVIEIISSSCQDVPAGSQLPDCE